MKKYNRSQVTGYRFLIFLVCCLQFAIHNVSSAQSLTSNAGSSVSICLNDSVQIGGNPSATGGTPPYTYSWAPATGLDVASIANPNAFPSSTTAYTLTVKDSLGNTSVSGITVTVLPLPTVSAGADQTITGGTNTYLQASGATDYSWFPVDGLDDETSATPSAEPGSTTTYCVAVQGTNGCTNYDCMTLEVIPNDSVIIYNAFTPNGDGVNEVLYIGNLQKYPDNKIEVFNRNGKLVFQGSNYQNDWNGKVDGAQLPCATYYVVFTPGDGKGKTSGSVTIIR